MGDKKILVLDVDETLLNIEPLFFLKKFKKNYKEYDGSFIFGKYYISARPNARLFLEKAREYFKLVAFSVADKEFTKQKLERLGMLNYFSEIYGNELLVGRKKVLNVIAGNFGRDLKDVFIVDDNPDFFVEQNNVIGVSPWFIGGDKNDNELMNMFNELKNNFCEVSPCI